MVNAKKKIKHTGLERVDRDWCLLEELSKEVRGNQQMSEERAL